MKRICRLGLVRSIFLLLTLFLPILGFADGGFFSARLTEIPPDIPAQRALLRQQNGQVTMVIESVLNGAPGNYGWLVPVPTTPAYVNSVKPDYLRQAFAKNRPNVRRAGRTGTFEYAMQLLAGIYWLTAGWRWRKQRPATRRWNILGDLILVSVVLFLTTGSALAKAADGGAATSKAVAEALGEYGSYSVFILDPAKSGGNTNAATEWLRQNDFRVSDEQAKTIADYSARGWKFMAAKFRHDVDGTLPPHPLKVVFPGNEIVYPMQLTGKSTPRLFLELLVVGKGSASVPGMRAFRSHRGEWKVTVLDEIGYRNDQFKDWKSTEIKGADANEVTTYLRGELRANDMKSDMPVRFETFRYVNEVLTPSDQIPMIILRTVSDTTLAIGFAFLLVALFSTEFMKLGFISVLVIGGAQVGLLLGSNTVIPADRVATEDAYSERIMRSIQENRTQRRMNEEHRMVPPDQRTKMNP